MNIVHHVRENWIALTVILTDTIQNARYQSENWLRCRPARFDQYAGNLRQTGWYVSRMARYDQNLNFNDYYKSVSWTSTVLMSFRLTPGPNGQIDHWGLLWVYKRPSLPPFHSLSFSLFLSHFLLLNLFHVSNWRLVKINLLFWITRDWVEYIFLIMSCN